MAFERETISDPVVHVSHPVKGRIPSAMGKPAKLLTEDEKTLYYERMAFLIEVPSIKDSAGGNDLSLTIGGVRSYSETNLCISTDGFIGEMKVTSLSEIHHQ